eukprot:CAMPEP_0175085054 /NCGR_PEP_ID=MMETSP0052_2-20121109/28430_1 /TAXON_ID=51329 ORGANISM="Polytomella parva, Strain SAG 63-3" /NCGR_SAMPLE_ID=MMETSP0052_2 /ASSEMBLY_ACC=CAM_ASM_000194 /LENGTH=563 /DNA_ID=CAMNT_0016356983 /DNA_START=234 /DNA_END=1921 /DNA_ORIENTATION=+
METSETYGLTEASLRDKEQQEKVLKEFELQRKIRQTVVPTDDVKVRILLRHLGEPITLFGEREMERRERLKKLFATRESELDFSALTNVIEPPGSTLADSDALPPRPTEIFYTEGIPGLRAARLAIAEYSLPRAQRRLDLARHLYADVEASKSFLRRMDTAAQSMREMSEFCSEIAGARPLAACQFSPDASMLAVGDWDGCLSVFEPLTCRKLWQTRVSSNRLTGLSWHPLFSAIDGSSRRSDVRHGLSHHHNNSNDISHDNGNNGDDGLGSRRSEGGVPAQATPPQTPRPVALATGDLDGRVKLWDAAGHCLKSLEGHTARCTGVSFHPMGAHVASGSYDLTWRLWDVDTGVCVLEQEGHSRPVYSVAFHPDGSLACSAGLDAYGRIWDLRTGRSLCLLEGHLQGLLCADFAADGWRVVTAGLDRTARVWDLRKRKCLYTIPGHVAAISTAKFEKETGSFLMTSSYDGLVKIWSGRDYRLIKTLASHENKVFCADFAPAAAVLADGVVGRRGAEEVGIEEVGIEGVGIEGVGIKGEKEGDDVIMGKGLSATQRPSSSSSSSS